MTNSNHETYEILVMKAVDGFLTDTEQRLLDEHLQTCDECREELQDFQVIKRSTDRVRERILQDAKIEAFRESTGVKAWNWGSFVLLWLGALVFFGFATYTFFLDPKVPLLVKVAAGLAGTGGIGLFAFILKTRLQGQAHDPYREIDL